MMDSGGAQKFALRTWICVCVVLYLWSEHVAAMDTDDTVIWRCPAFNLLKCKPLPPKCTSFRMIYIRHGHLECPGCLICGDLWTYEPWPKYAKYDRMEEDRKSEKIKQRKRRKRQRRQRQKEKKLRRISNKYNDIRIGPN